MAFDFQFFAVLYFLITIDFRMCKLFLGEVKPWNALFNHSKKLKLSFYNLLGFYCHLMYEIVSSWYWPVMASSYCVEFGVCVVIRILYAIQSFIQLSFRIQCLFHIMHFTCVLEENCKSYTIVKVRLQFKRNCCKSCLKFRFF
jgi:hypothetical protein